MTTPVDYPYEASDEASESELLDKSLSMWRGWGPLENEATFDPIPLDLHTAASIGQYDSVNAFILSGNTDINRPNKGYWTALMYASYIGHDNIVNLLLDAGANVDIKSDKGATALMLASSCGNESVAYFIIQQGSDIDCRDNRGWNALFHATYAGHQKMVQFLLESGANINAREPLHKMTPLMMAVTEGHEIIVNAFLEYAGIDVGAKSKYGETARSLALLSGHMKIVSLIDNRCMSPSGLLRSEAGLGGGVDLSSSDESYHRPNRPHGRSARSKLKGPSLRDGPEAIAKLLNEKKAPKPTGPATLSGPIVPGEYVSSFQGVDGLTEGSLRIRDVTSPIGSAEHDVDSYTSRSDSSWQDKPDQHNIDSNAFCISGALTIKSSGGSSCNSSSGGLKGILSRENSLSSNDEPREVKFSPDIERVDSPVQIPPHPVQGRGGYTTVPSGAMNYGSDSRTHHRHGNTDKNSGKDSHNVPAAPASGFIGYHPSVAPLTTADVVDNRGIDAAAAALNMPVNPYPFTDLKSVLESLNLQKYHPKLKEQDVDLRVFLTLTDADLKEVGIKLMGPRRKMTNAIARWHSQARPLSDNLEQVYADRMETAMQEMAEQLSESHLKKEQLEQKVLQERELRSVVEGCLLEDRKMYQQLHSLVSDTRQMCHNMRKIYDTVRSCQAELISRIEQGSGPTSPITSTTSELGLENLARNLNSQLHLDAISTNNNPPIRTNVTQQDAASLMREQLSLASGSSSPHHHDGGSTGNVDLEQMSMHELKGMLSHFAHQLGRSVALATNNMDQLIDGQNPSFSPSNSGNSLP